MTATALLKIAAECHRRKWAFDDGDNYVAMKAFRELSHIGDMAKKAWEECRENTPETYGIPKLPPKPNRPETTPVTGIRDTGTSGIIYDLDPGPEQDAFPSEAALWDDIDPTCRGLKE